MKTYIKITLLIACVAVFSQCKKNLNVQPDGSALEVIDFPDGFDFSTSKVVDLELAAPGVLSKSIFDIWYKKRDLSQEVILRGTFNVNGIFQMKVALPAHVDSLFVS